MALRLGRSDGVKEASYRNGSTHFYSMFSSIKILVVEYKLFRLSNYGFSLKKVNSK